MIADLDVTIRRLLLAEMPVNNGEIDIKFDQPRRAWSDRLTRPTINLFLYDLRENSQLRQHQWQISRQNGREAAQKRTPYRIDCAYIITAWTATPADQHRLLTRTLLALLRHPTLPRAQYQGQLQNQPFDLVGQLARHDQLTNSAELWRTLDNELRPSLSYLVTLALDPWTEITGPLVRAFNMHTNQMKDEGW